MVFASCEKIIDVNINDSEPQIVIEGKINTDTTNYIIEVKMTVPYNATENSLVNDALVTLSDDLGATQTLTFIGNGQYETTSMFGVVGREYILKVEQNGQIYEHPCLLKTPTPLDSVGSIYFAENEVPGVDEGIYLAVSFTDPVGLGDRYRLVVTKNDTVFNGPNDYYLFWDKFDDGLQDIVIYFDEDYRMQSGDRVTVELWTLDERVFDFYNTLDDILAQGFQPSGVPDNPNSSWSNGALGYFNAYSYDVDSIVIP